MRRIEVREATPEDEEEVAAISSLATATLRETYRPKGGFRSDESAPLTSRTRLVAVMDERVVGTVRYAHEADRIHLIGLFVHPDFQRQGVARQIVAHLAVLGARRGARCLSLHAVKETGNAVIFERLGFRTVSERVDDSIESDSFAQLTDVYMERPCTTSAGADDVLETDAASKHNPSQTGTTRTIA